MKKIEKYKDITKENILIIIEVIEKQIFHQDEKFASNSRMLLEIFYYYIINFEKGFCFELEDKIIKFEESENNEKNIKDQECKVILEKIKSTRNNISVFLHWNPSQKEILILKPEEIEAIIKKINSIIKLINEKKYFEEIKFEKIKFEKIKRIKFNRSSISLNEVLFSEILDEHYNIPMFQRKFTWICEKINDLFKEIIEGERDLGIIYITNENKIIDGQQRLHSIYIINKILYRFFNEELKRMTFGKKEFEDFETKFERERESEEDWRSNQFLLEKEIKNSNKKDSRLNEVYIKIEENKDKLEKIYENINKLFINLKKIKDKDGVKYFNKINNQGVPLKKYENILSFFIYKYKLNEKEKNKLYDKWSELDDLCCEDFNNNFIERILEFVEKDKDILEINFIIEFFENLIKIIENTINVEEYFILQSNYKFSSKNFEERDYLKLLYCEIRKRIEFSFDIKDNEKIDLLIIEEMRDDFYNSNFYFIFIQSFLKKVLNKYLIIDFKQKDLINLNNSFNSNRNIFSEINKTDIEILKLLNDGNPKFLYLDKNNYNLKISNINSNINFPNLILDISIINTYRIIEEVIEKFIKNELFLFKELNNFIINKIKEFPSIVKQCKLQLHNFESQNIIDPILKQSMKKEVNNQIQRSIFSQLNILKFNKNFFEFLLNLEENIWEEIWEEICKNHDI